MRAVCSRAARSCSANRRVTPCGSQAAARRLCGSARVKIVCNVGGGPQQPASSHVVGEAEVEVIKILVQKKASKQAISAFLRNLEALEVARPKAEVARLRGALNVSKLGCIADVAHLKGELYVVDLQLRMIVTSYLSLQGRLSMRGLLEYIQRRMGRRGVTWDSQDPAGAWDEYIAKSPSLQRCLEKRNVNVQGAGAELSKVYWRLTEDDSKTPKEQQAHGSKLYIGLPLEQQQRELMACLCEYEGVDYAVLPVMMKDA